MSSKNDSPSWRGLRALALASGQTAETLTILTLAQAGDDIVSSAELYGGTVSLFTHTLPKLGITTTFVPPHDADAWEAAVTPQTKAFFIDTIGNPIDIIDIQKIVELGQKHGIPLIVDNTVTTPYLLRPFEHGAAIVIHSATKFIGGHGTSIGGAIVDSGHFQWGALLVLREMLRIGRFSIVGFPNFGHWQMRLGLLLKARAPKSPALPFEWYNTPNFRHLIVKDMRDYCRREKMKIIRENYLIGSTWHTDHLWRYPVNTFAHMGLFVITRSV
jgi:hypothetical protein